MARKRASEDKAMRGPPEDKAAVAELTPEELEERELRAKVKAAIAKRYGRLVTVSAGPDVTEDEIMGRPGAWSPM